MEDSDEEEEDAEESWERPPSLYDTQDMSLKEGYLMMRGQCTVIREGICT